MIANYHTHTYHCRHAVGTMEEYVQAAIADGIKILGFSDHVPYPLENLAPRVHCPAEETGQYVSEIKALQEKYKDQIRLYIGYEAEYYEKYFDLCLEHIEKYGYDYLIQGQHFVPDEFDGGYVGKATEDIQVVMNYTDLCIKGMQTGKFIYLAHPDLVHYVGGDDATYWSCMREICDAAKALDMPLEWNINGMMTGRNYPTRRFFTYAAENENKVIIGVDAHQPEMFAPKNIEKAEGILREIGCNVISKIDLFPKVGEQG